MVRDNKTRGKSSTDTLKMWKKIRNGEIASKETLNTICKLLNCQPGDILEYIDVDE